MANRRPSSVWNTASGTRRSGEAACHPATTSSVSTARTSSPSKEATAQNRRGTELGDHAVVGPGLVGVAHEALAAAGQRSGRFLLGLGLGQPPGQSVEHRREGRRRQGRLRVRQETLQLGRQGERGESPGTAHLITYLGAGPRHRADLIHTLGEHHLGQTPLHRVHASVELLAHQREHGEEPGATTMASWPAVHARSSLKPSSQEAPCVSLIASPSVRAGLAGDIHQRALHHCASDINLIGVLA